MKRVPRRPAGLAYLVLLAAFAAHPSAAAVEGGLGLDSALVERPFTDPNRCQ